MASDGSESDMESSPDLEEFLASSFYPDVSNNEEQAGGQDNEDTLGLEPYHFETFLSGAESEDSESQSDPRTDSSRGDSGLKHPRLQDVDWWESIKQAINQSMTLL